MLEVHSEVHPALGTRNECFVTASPLSIARGPLLSIPLCLSFSPPLPLSPLILGAQDDCSGDEIAAQAGQRERGAPGSVFRLPIGSTLDEEFCHFLDCLHLVRACALAYVYEHGYVSEDMHFTCKHRNP